MSRVPQVPGRALPETERTSSLDVPGVRRAACGTHRPLARGRPVRWSAASNRGRSLTMAELIEFLERKPFTVWAALGFREGDAPAWCLWTRLPVLPITARPYHVSSTESGSPTQRRARTRT